MDYKRIFIENSLIFITVVTKDRKNILIDNISFLRKAFKLAKEKYKFEIIAIIVNPNHFHMIIKPDKIEEYPKIIGFIKSSFTKLSKIKYTLSINNREANIWQRRYWEHTIINENDLHRHLDYIHFNSMKHYSIPPKEWKYSTFKKYVNKGVYELDWCNFDNKYGINEMNLE